METATNTGTLYLKRIGEDGQPVMEYLGSIDMFEIELQPKCDEDDLDEGERYDR